MSFKLHLILAASVFMQIRCNFPEISYLSETQKNNFQFLNKFLLSVSPLPYCRLVQVQCSLSQIPFCPLILI